MNHHALDSGSSYGGGNGWLRGGYHSEGGPDRWEGMKKMKLKKSENADGCVSDGWDTTTSENADGGIL